MANFLFDFHTFEFVHGVFKLPREIYLFRSEKSNSPFDFTTPLFFGDYEVASSYMGNGRLLRVYEPKSRIRVLDLRYVQAILPKLFQSIRLSRSDLEVIYQTSLVFGLVSFQKQIEMLEDLNIPALQPMLQRMREFAALPNKPSWVHPFEMQGVRCSITEMDYKAIHFLKELFGDIIDGVIAPALPTPFHGHPTENIQNSMFLQELILFNPDKVLYKMDLINKLEYVDRYNAQKYIEDLMPGELIDRQQRIRPSRIALQTGGSSNHPLPEPRDSMAEQIAAGDIKLQRQLEQFIKKAQKLANKLKKTQIYLRYYCPNICVLGTPVSGTLCVGNLV